MSSSTFQPPNPANPSTDAAIPAITQPSKSSQPSHKRSLDDDDDTHLPPRKRPTDLGQLPLSPPPLILSGTSYLSAEKALIASLQSQISAQQNTISALRSTAALTAAEAKQNAIAYADLETAYANDVIRVHDSYEQFGVYYAKSERLEKELMKREAASVIRDEEAQGIMENTLVVTQTLEETIKALRTQLDQAAYSKEDFPVVQDLKKVVEDKDATIKSLESKLAQAKKDQEFFREQYQRASSEGGMLNGQVQDLTRELVDANRRADEVKIKVHTLNIVNREAIYAKRIKELVAEVQHFKDGIEWQRLHGNRLGAVDVVPERSTFSAPVI